MESPKDAGSNIQDRLSAMGINPANLTVAATESPQEREIRYEKIRHQEKFEEWTSKVAEVRAETVALREGLEAKLREDVESGRLGTLGAAEERLATIDATVTKGPEMKWVYNRDQGSDFHRTQPCFRTVDEQGNVWGEFELPGEAWPSTGKQPLAPGMRIICPNPTLPKPE
ncbi:MAG: hypothetical protein JWO35_520 [Candidatus Saccharibacteria bacterium]|nr:hypothetical protein [Candidatus Saccharibacteria bacterium]